MRRLATVRVRITVAAVLVVGRVAGGRRVLARARAPRPAHRPTSRPPRGCGRRTSPRPSTTATSRAIARRAARRREPRAGRRRQRALSSRRRRTSSGDARISTLQPDADGYVGAHGVRHRRQGDGPYRVVARRVQTATGTYVVYVARSLEGVARSTDSLERLLWWSLPALLTLDGRPTWVVTGRALRPVEAIRREVEVIGGEDLHRRVPEPATEDEIGRLARTMNAMLDPARGRHRPSAPVRRRRQPRAAQPAHGHPRPARGGPRAPRARRLADDRARGARRRDPAAAAGRRPAGDRGGRRVRARRCSPRAGRPRRDRARRGPPAAHQPHVADRRHARGVGCTGRRQRRPAAARGAQPARQRGASRALAKSSCRSPSRTPTSR